MRIAFEVKRPVQTAQTHCRCALPIGAVLPRTSSASIQAHVNPHGRPATSLCSSAWPSLANTLQGGHSIREQDKLLAKCRLGGRAGTGNGHLL